MDRHNPVEVDTPAQPAATPLPTPTPEVPREMATDETVKETIESIVIAFILAFIFRAFVVEPFIIPTGSMAPTLLGAHLPLNCPSCGYGFDVGIDSGIAPEGGSLRDSEYFDCPMCNLQIVAEPGTRVRAGDRILVDKFSYHIQPPSRWDVVVFKAPKGQMIGGEPAPRTNFIKRLVGLPGERIAILDGNIYTAPAGTEDFTIARKTDPKQNLHWQSIQRSVWQPIFHSEFVPIQDATASAPDRDDQHAWRVPWQAVTGEWDLGTPHRPSRVYLFAGGEGEIQFQFAGDSGTPRYDAYYSMFPYNKASSMGDDFPIEDIRLACAVTPGASPMQIKLETTARLDHPSLGIETLEARISSEGEVSLHAISVAGEERSLGAVASIGPLKPGIATDIELWLVDDDISVWINGEQVLTYRIELSWSQVADRVAQLQKPQVRIGIASKDPVQLRRVELDRDLYYYAQLYSSYSITRAEARRRDGSIALGPKPLDLSIATDRRDAEMFVLGDNQPASEDGRGWNDVDGWVRERYFDGQSRPGVVPTSLLVGRAFMVYYPAPLARTPYGSGFLPDFGRMRFVH